jgi:chaperonin GroEL
LQASDKISEFLKTEYCNDILPEERAGLVILKNALMEPFKQILNNAGVEYHEFMSKIVKNKGFCGYDALKGAFVENMLERGIIDPSKVVKMGISNAVSASGILLTTDVCIFDDLSALDQK